MSDTKVAHPGVEPLSRCGRVGPLFAFEWAIRSEDFDVPPTCCATCVWLLISLGLAIRPVGRETRNWELKRGYSWQNVSTKTFEGWESSSSSFCPQKTTPHHFLNEKNGVLIALRRRVSIGLSN